MKDVERIKKEQDIELVFIFGSQKNRAVRFLNAPAGFKPNKSDLDIGVFVSAQAFQAIKDKFTYYGRLYDIFTDIFPVFNLDIVLLNEVSVFIQAEAFKGYPLYCRSKDSYDALLEEVNKKYCELNFIRKLYYKEMQEAILYG